ncbi:MAG: TIGR04282 family arsenosugar biosynthesis glycosyltransferase [Lachnospiraceae bacterium]
MKRAVILFTKAPIKGNVKTRMQSLIKPEECGMIQKYMIADIAHTCQSSQWDLFVSYTPKEECMMIKELCADATDYLVQKGNSLGDKMTNAIEQILNRGYSSCVLIGSDIPDIKTKDLEEAFQTLETKDVVFGPTIDKGYYLVGMNQLRKEVFQKQTYGTGNVLEQTMNRIHAAGITTGLLTSYHDMDVPDDLYRFHDEHANHKTEYAPRTRKYVHYLMEVYQR